MENGTDKPDIVVTENKSKPLGGYIIFAGILVVCIVIAFLISGSLDDSGPDPDAVVSTPGGSVSDSQPGHGQDNQSDPPVGNNASSMGQFLLSLNNILNEYNEVQGRLPNTFSDMAQDPDFTMPSINDSGRVRQDLLPGEFASGGYSYIPFRLTVGGPYMGFILIGYGETEASGVTIDNPIDLLNEPGIIEDRYMKPLKGVTVAIRENGRPIDLAVFE